MERKNNRGIQFDGKKFKIFLNTKRAELDVPVKEFFKFLKISKNTVYSCISHQSMERSTFGKFKKKLGEDTRFQEIFIETQE